MLLRQTMLLHCCPQSETWCLKNCARYLADGIKLVGGPDAAGGQKFWGPKILVLGEQQYFVWDAVFQSTK